MMNPIWMGHRLAMNDVQIEDGTHLFHGERKFARWILFQLLARVKVGRQSSSPRGLLVKNLVWPHPRTDEFPISPDFYKGSQELLQRFPRHLSMLRKGVGRVAVAKQRTLSTRFLSSEIWSGFNVQLLSKQGITRRPDKLGDTSSKIVLALVPRPGKVSFLGNYRYDTYFDDPKRLCKEGEGELEGSAPKW